MGRYLLALLGRRFLGTASCFLSISLCVAADRLKNVKRIKKQIIDINHRSKPKDL